MMSGYLSPAKRRMFWEKKEDTGNTLVKKAMFRNTFDDRMRYTHFANNLKPKDDDCFWKLIKGKPPSFGYKVWVLATSKGELIRCEPYGGAKTKLFDYGIGQGPNVVYGLVEYAKLVAGSKIACDNLFSWTRKE
ncbi:hypothetical protein O3P69_009240 [Scylla paramamosain]|uniref:PiggyBac transposable element-derived protein domain-containing protein n=1 Tax=Scylla paramamosain TaxID=85552 RepID=A0AAW0T9Q8_SCYPA